MAVPSVSDFKRYIGSLLNNNDWNVNLKTIVNFLTTNYNVTFGTVAATSYTGDISACTGFPESNIVINAGEPITAGDLVRVFNGEAYIATNANAAGIMNFLGVAVNTALAGEQVTIERSRYDAFSGLADSDTYYIGLAGALTNTKPASYAKPIGFAESETTLIIQPNTESDTTFSEINTTGDVSIGNDISVTNDASVQNDMTIGNDLSVTGSIELSKGLLSDLSLRSSDYPNTGMYFPNAASPENRKISLVANGYENMIVNQYGVGFGVTPTNPIETNGVARLAEVRVSNGTVSAPAIYPTTDVNTGFFFPSGDGIAFSSEGSERMRITGAGSVGVGTTTPSGAFQVVGTTNLDLAVISDDIYTSDLDYLVLIGSTTGFSSLTNRNIYTRRLGNLVIARFAVYGVSNSSATTFTFTLPSSFTTSATFGGVFQSIIIQDNSNYSLGVVSAPAGSSVFTFYKDLTLTAPFTATGQKGVFGTIVYVRD